ncbi:DNA (cytosine-5)-methyltransferase 3A-like [Pomacea canaliculata]|uniref:DNA (cytosine-5)-methyltransferase 3A-like n=1 Tax=Pomacea canaliculata TaxID=400727 RepID=UPI000D7348F0|nr:DNA (cytosine-5)-methyltransferase 3A-like [Pomacea canaliculata]
MVNLTTSDPDQAFVFWFSDWKVSAVDRNRMLPFVKYFKTKAALCRGKQNRRGILQIIQECQRRAMLKGFEIVKMDPLQWAFSGFPTVEDSKPDIFSPVPDKIFSDAISDRLAAIGEDIRKKAALKDRDIPNEFQKESSLEAVWRGDTAIEDVCIGCCDAGRKVCCEHPLFEGGLCTKCKEVLQETFYAIGDDGGYANCTVCGASGKLLSVMSRTVDECTAFHVWMKLEALLCLNKFRRQVHGSAFCAVPILKTLMGFSRLV